MFGSLLILNLDHPHKLSADVPQPDTVFDNEFSFRRGDSNVDRDPVARLEPGPRDLNLDRGGRFKFLRCGGRSKRQGVRCILTRLNEDAFRERLSFINSRIDCCRKSMVDRRLVLSNDSRVSGMRGIADRNAAGTNWVEFVLVNSTTLLPVINDLGKCDEGICWPKRAWRFAGRCRWGSWGGFRGYRSVPKPRVED